MFIWLAKVKRAREVRKNGRFKHDQIVQTVDHLKSKHPNVDKKLFTGYQSIEIRVRVRVSFDKGQKFIDFVKSDRFVVETAMIHRLHTAHKLGEWRSIYNPETSEVFTYHYDTHKGVGKKYCISHGLVRTTDKPSVKECCGQIPA